MDILFAYYLIKPEDVDLKDSYLQGVRTQQAVNSVPIKELEKMGYTEEQIQGIVNDYKRTLR